MISADVRGSTALGEKLSHGEFAALLDRFYRVAMDLLLPQKAIVIKMIRDEVMEFFVPAFHGSTTVPVVADRFPGVPAETIEVRGRGEGYGVRVITPFGWYRGFDCHVILPGSSQ